MGQVRETQHFVTLFNHKFLPMGMSLHESLLKHASPVCLWIICMDELVEEQLRKLSLKNVKLISLRDVETPSLLKAKADRSEGEYCWTLTPFACSAVMDRDSSVWRVTYIDADLYFFNDPQLLFAELEAANKEVLITEHHYEPRYDQTATAGRFCVQFVTFTNTAGARKVMGWWQERCLEWCYARYEDGKFGDQVYLNQWPDLFDEHVHVLKHNERIYSPWNVSWQLETLKQQGRDAGAQQPVFYHYHGLRPETSARLRVYSHYHISPKAQHFYDEYTESFRRQIQRMNELYIPLPLFPSPGGLRAKAQQLYSELTGHGQFRKI